MTAAWSIGDRAVYGAARPVLVLTVCGELDRRAVAELDRLLRSAATVPDDPALRERYGCRRLGAAAVVDLRCVPDLGRVLAAVVEVCRGIDGTVRLVVARRAEVLRQPSWVAPRVLEVFEDLVDAVLAAEPGPERRRHRASEPS